jgi:hypothetical protein
MDLYTEIHDRLEGLRERGPFSLCEVVLQNNKVRLQLAKLEQDARRYIMESQLASQEETEIDSVRSHASPGIPSCFLEDTKCEESSIISLGSADKRLASSNTQCNSQADRAPEKFIWRGHKPPEGEQADHTDCDTNKAGKAISEVSVFQSSMRSPLTKKWNFDFDESSSRRIKHVAVTFEDMAKCFGVLNLPAYHKIDECGVDLSLLIVAQDNPLDCIAALPRLAKQLIDICVLHGHYWYTRDWL